MEDYLKKIWQEVINSAPKFLPPGTPDMWLGTCVPLSLESGVLAISVPNSFAKENVEKKIIPSLAQFLSIKGYASGIAVMLDEPELADDVEVVEPAPAQKDKDKEKDRDKGTVKNGLNPNYVFETFVVGSSNRLAHASSLAVSESPGEAYNPLFIWGGVGLGKTHLMHAIGNYVSMRDKDAKIMYVSSEKFTNDMIASIKNTSSHEFRSKYRNVDVLLIDDIQFIGNKEGTQEAFFNTFNSLHDEKKQIVICSDRPPKEIKGVEERLVSRFEWGIVTDIQQPDLETRVAILQKKAEMKGYSVPDEVINYIAQNIPSNIRELEGALNRVVANATVNGEPMSDANLAVWLKDIVRDGSLGSVSIDQIQQLVSDSFGISVDEMLSTKRTSEIASARQIAMYISRTVLNEGYQQIAHAFNKKDHTTVIYACDKIADKIKADPRTRTIVDNIKNKIKM